MKNSETAETVLRLKDISKRFPGVLANDAISFDLRRQEIHALLGENGAGKSTLMNIISGLYQPDAGELQVNDQVVSIHSPNDSLKLGIGMVHQHFMLIPVMTVTENIMLGHEDTRGLPLGRFARLDREKVKAEIIALGERYGLKVDPDALVEDLSVGEAQRVEILKALYRGAEILILDEPTAVLTPQETEELFAIMHSLVEQGRSIIFITHKLKEVLAIADRITVLRNGRVVGTTLPKSTSMQQLAAMMVGREVILAVDRGDSHPGQVVLDVQQLTVLDKHETPVVKQISFQVRAGEIYGLAGVQGNGQTELVEALAGLLPASGGSIRVLDTEMAGLRPRAFTNAGLAHVPEDRQKQGLVLGFSVDINLILQTYYQQPFARRGFINLPAIETNARQLVAQYDIRTPSTSTMVRSLSGGNQQKVIIAREFSRPIKLLVVNQPTRGLDVGSIEFIHRRIIEIRDAGVAVFLVSAELDEILALSDRIGVMFAGEIVAEFDSLATDRETLGLYMAGLGRTEI